MSLWGEDFDIKIPEKPVKSILKKIRTPKVVSAVKAETTHKKRGNKELTDSDIKQILADIKVQVQSVLGVYKNKTICIRTIEQLHDYINAAIKNNIIAIDTETNNSLDPITCMIMGGCIYTPGQLQAYIPIHHVDVETKELLSNQVTEAQLKEEFDRLNENKVKIITHNGKFDYEVLKCTCNYIMPIYWDTMIGAKLIDENEDSYGLKQQYIKKIDPSIEKYSIDLLFEKISYGLVDPEVFALYSATDAYMTYKLYEYQMRFYMQEKNKKVFELATEIEMPLTCVIGEMELNGMAVDKEYNHLLSIKYHKLLDEIDSKIAVELEALKPAIDEWRKSPEAQEEPIVDNKQKKSKASQLAWPINLASPVQLAILFYDVLKLESVSKKAPRGTGENELLDLSKKYKLPVCDLILQRRAQVKLITTYIDIMPDLINRWPDGRIRTHFNQYGAATGRLSSSDPINF